MGKSQGSSCSGHPGRTAKMELGADLEDPGSLCGGCPGRTAEAEVSASWSGLMG